MFSQSGDELGGEEVLSGGFEFVDINYVFTAKVRQQFGDGFEDGGGGLEGTGWGVEVSGGFGFVGFDACILVGGDETFADAVVESVAVDFSEFALGVDDEGFDFGVLGNLEDVAGDDLGDFVGGLEDKDFAFDRDGGEGAKGGAGVLEGHGFGGVGDAELLLFEGEDSFFDLEFGFLKLEVVVFEAKLFLFRLEFSLVLFEGDLGEGGYWCDGEEGDRGCEENQEVGGQELFWHGEVDLDFGFFG